MKKSLLIGAVLLAAGTAAAQSGAAFSAYQGPMPEQAAVAGTRASGSFTFGYSGEPQSALSLNNVTAGTTVVYLATEIRSEDVKMLAGNKITALNIYGGTKAGTTNYFNPVTRVNAFITKDLSKDPVAIQEKFKMGATAFGMNTVTFDTPYEISASDDKLYIGYSFTVPTGTAYYIPIDMVTANANNLIFGYINGQGLPSQWNFAGEDGYGSLCISMNVEGDNLPENKASILGLTLPEIAKLGSQASATLSVRNCAANAIESLEVSATVGSAEPYVQTITPTAPIAVNSSAEITVDGIRFDAEGLHTVTLAITKINGVAVSPAISASGSVIVLEKGYDRNIVVEEGTGTWCGWCPAGAAMLEYMARTYPERMIGIACHGNDAMEISEYGTFMNVYFGGSYPNSVTNRKVQHSPGSSQGPQVNYDFIDEMYKHYTSSPAYCEIKIVPTVDESTKTVKIDATAEFAIDTDIKHYLSFVITENAVGPYPQANYYAGGGNGPMAGWENLESTAKNIYFNDVARAYKAYPGIEGSLPEKIEAGKPYTFSTSMSMSKVKGPHYAIIGLITNAETGEIVNATRYATYQVGVEGIEADDTENIKVMAANGSIRVTGARNVAVYTLDGRMTGTDGLANGLYIVVADGKSFKVMMR